MIAIVQHVVQVFVNVSQRMWQVADRVEYYFLPLWLLVLAMPSIAADVPGNDSVHPIANGISQAEVRFFPKEVLGSFKVLWYSQHLAAMNERNLNEKAAPNGVAPPTEAYRFLWLRTFHHPVAVRLESSSDGYRVVLKELDGKGGYAPGKLLTERSREVSREDWNELARRIKECSFWKMKTNEEQSYVDENGLVVSWGIADGAMWILEGRRQGSYHIVDRQSPDTEIDRRQLAKYRELCLYILKLADFDLESTRVY